MTTTESANVAALARITMAMENEARYHEALHNTGTTIVDIAGRMDSGLLSSEDAVTELLATARSILVALRLENEPEK